MHHVRSATWIAIVAVWLVCGLTDRARAATTAVQVDLTNLNSFDGYGDHTKGWGFNVSTDILVTQLSVLDVRNDFNSADGDGLLYDHQIGIWSLANPATPLITATITGGTVTPMTTNNFRYVSVTPTLLSAGDYVIGSNHELGTPSSYDGSVTASNNATITFAPEITWTNARSSVSSGFVFPEFPLLVFGQGNIGPNFSFTVVPAPAASLMGLVLLGGLGIVGTIRRRLK